MQNKQQYMFATAVVVIAVVTVGLVAIPGLSQKVSADRDSKSKFWGTEDGSIIEGLSCSKDNGGCKDLKESQGANLNKVVRENCESQTDEKCKQFKP
jgi:hypothetical protein